MKSNKEQLLVDTSVWIEFFNRPESLHAKTVKGLLRSDRVCLAGVVAAEIIQGIRDDHERKVVLDSFGILPYLEDTRKDWFGAGRSLCDLRRQGVTVPLTDAILAQICENNGVRLYTIDKHFDHFPNVERFHPEPEKQEP